MINRLGLIGAFNDLRNALLTCNEQQLNELIADKYQGFSLRGHVESKETILQNFTPGIVTLTQYTVEDVEYEVFDSIGIVTGKGFIAGHFGEYKFQHDVFFTDIFRYTDKKWIYYKSQVTEIPGNFSS